MKKYLSIFAIGLLGLILLAGVSLGGFAMIYGVSIEDLWGNKYKPMINWFPERIEQDQFPGTVEIITTKFTSQKDLENVKFWITPPLKKYATIEPETIDKIEKNKEYTIQIIVSLPSDISSKDYSERHLDEDLKGENKELKEYLEEHKDLKNYLRKFLKKRIPGLVFVVSEKSVPWFKFQKDKERKIRTVYPEALRVIINIKEPSAELIPEEITSPIFNRIKEDPAIGQNYIDDEIIVKFKDGTSEEIIKQIVKSIDGVFIGFSEELGIYQLQVDVAGFNELDQKISQLEQSTNVEFAGRQVVTIPSLKK